MPLEVRRLHMYVIFLRYRYKFVHNTLTEFGNLYTGALVQSSSLSLYDLEIVVNICCVLLVSQVAGLLHLC